MKKPIDYSLIFGIVMLWACQSTTEPTSTLPATTPYDQPPAWAKSAIWYEIAVERFYNGDPSNDPTPEDMTDAYPGFVPDGWSVTPWTHDWYAPDAYWSNIKDQTDFYGNPLTNFAQRSILRRYGGDLQGVWDKLDYLDSLGINAIYFRPLNDSPSHHKYDARTWRHIDRNFGPDPAQDKITIDAEVPNDPSTWQWTSADKLFLKLVEELHARDIKVIMDYSFNHTGKSFWAWQDVIEKQAKSKYKDWYWVDAFDEPGTAENEFDYHGWFGVHELPEIKETQRQDLSERVRTFEGDIYSQGVKDHIFALTARWLDPNGDGDPSDGVDGYRLDVAAETPLGFWREFRQHVRGIHPDAYLLGEIWWEQWPDHLLDPEPVLQGDVFDAVMNYRWYRAARHFLASAPGEIPVSELIDSLQSFRSNLTDENAYAMMNLNASFDTPRVLTSLFNKNKYKYYSKPIEDSTYRIHKPDDATFEALALLLVHQYTYVGAPHIWAGDEMGMWGADDPSTRKPTIWPEFDFDDEVAHPLDLERPVDEVRFNRDLFRLHQRLITMRKGNPVLCHGGLTYLQVSDSPKVLAYKRHNATSEVLVLINTDTSEVVTEMVLAENAKYEDLVTGEMVTADGQSGPLKIPSRGYAVLKSLP